MDAYHGSLREPSQSSRRLVEALAQLRESELRLTSALARLLDSQRRLAESLVRLRESQARLVEELKQRFPAAPALPVEAAGGSGPARRLACPPAELEKLVASLHSDALN